jgi:hypothetical protein
MCGLDVQREDLSRFMLGAYTITTRTTFLGKPDGDITFPLPRTIAEIYFGKK